MWDLNLLTRKHGWRGKHSKSYFDVTNGGSAIKLIKFYMIHPLFSTSEVKLNLYWVFVIFQNGCQIEHQQVRLNGKSNRMLHMRTI